MRKILIGLCGLLAFTSCSKDKVTISGSIENADKIVLHLDEVDVYNTIPVDSVKLDKKGRFNFKMQLKQPGFYQLRLTPDKVIVLFPSPGEKITINANAGKLPASVDVDGSHDTEQIAKLNLLLAEARLKLDSLAMAYENADDESVKVQINSEYQAVLEGHRKASIAYILTHYNSLSSVYAIYQQYFPGNYLFYKASDLQFFKILSDSLSKYHPGSRHVKSLVSYTNKMVGQYNTSLMLSRAKVSDGTLPEIDLPDLNGTNKKLSEVKAKYILLSFWITGNELCVRQNLELKKIYGQYRAKGFEIYQVSFDNSPERWQNLIRFDEIPWISVIDTGYSPVAGNYNISQLPANYLIDKSTKSIIGKNLTPSQVKNKLEDLIN